MGYVDLLDMVLFNTLLIGHMYLIGVQLREDQRPDTMKILDV